MDFDEFRELAVSSGTVPVLEIQAPCKIASAKTLVGKGKVAEIAEAVKALGAHLVIFSHPLTPAQTRNLEDEMQCRVIDRIDLILHIFAARAHTFEGKLQVELAQLHHLSTRLVRGWSHLERQKGGIGLRGPGETQLEVDRRLIRGRIASIEKQLEKVRKDRFFRRHARERANRATVALVGYTNSGKSSLFNALCNAHAYVANQLFATLDPTLRSLGIPEFGDVVLADTVGFIRDLPHELINAFRATLEETRTANLLLHVIDASDPEQHYKMKEVVEVLTHIGAEAVPSLLVFNKIDLLDHQYLLNNPGHCHPRSAKDPSFIIMDPRFRGDDKHREGTCPGLLRSYDHQPDEIEYDSSGKPTKVWVSALTGAGLQNLLKAIAVLLSEDIVEQKVHLLPTEGKIRSALYDIEAVVSEYVELDGSYTLVVHLPRQVLMKILHGTS